MKNEFNSSNEDFSRNATNSRDDVDRNEHYSSYGHGNQQSSGQQYRNFNRGGSPSDSYSSDYGQTAPRQDHYRGANQFGLHNQGFQSEKNDYYRGNRYGRMNSELNRYDSEFEHRRGGASGNRDAEWGERRGYGDNRGASNREFSPDNQGYNGRNASDYNNSLYSDHYYYSPNENEGQRRRSTYGSEHNGRLSNYYGRQHSDYFDHHPERDEKGAYNYYGSYPSYNQSAPTDRDHEERDRPNIRDSRY